jgi:hypothetical protein
MKIENLYSWEGKYFHPHEWRFHQNSIHAKMVLTDLRIKIDIELYSWSHMFDLWNANMDYYVLGNYSARFSTSNLESLLMILFILYIILYMTMIILDLTINIILF